MICRNPVKTTDKKSVYTLGHTDNIEYSKDQNLTQKISDMDKNISANSSKIIKLEEFQKTVISTVADALYPVGSIKITFDETHPANTLPGTEWELINSGKYVKMGTIGSDTSKQGGTKSINLSHTHAIPDHTLTVDEIPSHDHEVQTVNNNFDFVGDGTQTEGGTADLSTGGGNYWVKQILRSVKKTGGGKAHNHGDSESALSTMNIEPEYQTLFFWKRTK